jgi:hypothetical protein
MSAEPRPGSAWRHFKGHAYVVERVVRHSTDLAPLVIYRNTETNEYWARPLAEWHDHIERPEYSGPRFKEIG